jgi:hypothetical protein
MARKYQALYDEPTRMLRLVRDSRSVLVGGISAFSTRFTDAQLASYAELVAKRFYVDTSKQVGDPEHLKVFANADAAEASFAENDPEGVALEDEVTGPPA